MLFTGYTVQMEFAWTAHRFSGGLLALDLANTVVCRFDPKRRVDRLADLSHIAGFQKAAKVFRPSELTRPVSQKLDDEAMRCLIDLRESIDAWARQQTRGAVSSHHVTARLLSCCAVACERWPRSLAAAAALSAVRLFGSQELARIRVCPNCDWLFVDRSKNGSRRWCDMAVCGNRAKAKTHYHRQKQGAS
jgi:predicted RNA-binding Zn ribbon-like protein